LSKKKYLIIDCNLSDSIYDARQQHNPKPTDLKAVTICS